MPHHQEVTEAFRAAMDRAGRHASAAIESARRQAPAARLIGEFAVKHLLREVEKRRPGRQQPQTDGPLEGAASPESSTTPTSSP